MLWNGFSKLWTLWRLGRSTQREGGRPYYYFFFSSTYRIKNCTQFCSICKTVHQKSVNYSLSCWCFLKIFSMTDWMVPVWTPQLRNSLKQQGDQSVSSFQCLADAVALKSLLLWVKRDNTWAAERETELGTGLLHSQVEVGELSWTLLNGNKSSLKHTSTHFTSNATFRGYYLLFIVIITFI